MRLCATLIVALVLCDAALAGRGRDKKRGGGRDKKQPNNKGNKDKNKQFKEHPNGRLPPGHVRRLLAQARVKVNGRELQFFTEQMLVDLQQALHDLRQCRTKPDGKAKKFTVDETPFSVDTDVIPTLQRVQNAIADCEADKNPNSARRRRRQVVAYENNFWATDRSVKIVLSDHAATEAMNVKGFFEVFIKEMSAKTCLQLELATTAPSNEPYILIITELTDNNAGCWTYAGRSNGAGASYIPAEYKDENAHPIFMSQGCWEYATVTHEFLHALGLYHEQSRTDRSEYIDIHWDNIQENAQGQYGDCSPWGCKTAPNAYDPLSVMHYGRTGFAIDSDKPTMSPKSHLDWDNLMGSAVDLSFSDYYRINDMYCKASCPNAACGEGYPDPHDCSQCLCPTGVGQGNCDRPVPSWFDFICGGILESTGEWQQLNLKNKLFDPEPNHCKWVIQAPNSGKVQLETRGSTVFKSSSAVQPCYWAQFEVRTADFGKPNDAYCGSEVSQRSYESAADRLLAIYRYNYYDRDTEFTIYYRTKADSEQSATTTPAPDTTTPPPDTTTAPPDTTTPPPDTTTPHPDTTTPPPDTTTAPPDTTTPPPETTTPPPDTTTPPPVTTTPVPTTTELTTTTEEPTTTAEPKPAALCPFNYFYCEYGTPWLFWPPTFGKCIHRSWLCDGWRDCRYTAEDEDPANCPSW